MNIKFILNPKTANVHGKKNASGRFVHNTQVELEYGHPMVRINRRSAEVPDIILQHVLRVEVNESLAGVNLAPGIYSLGNAKGTVEHVSDESVSVRSFIEVVSPTKNESLALLDAICVGAVFAEGSRVISYDFAKIIELKNKVMGDIIGYANDAKVGISKVYDKELAPLVKNTKEFLS